MSYAERHDIAITTATGGGATGYSPVITGSINAIIYTKDDFTDGVDFTITAEGTGQGLWTELNVNASKTVAPRQPTHDVVGVASLYAAAGEDVEDQIAIAKDRVKIVIAAGGNTKSGTFTVIVR